MDAIGTQQIVLERWKGDNSTRGEPGWVIGPDRQFRVPIPWNPEVHTIVCDQFWEGPVEVGDLAVSAGKFADGRARFVSSPPQLRVQQKSSVQNPVAVQREQ